VKKKKSKFWDVKISKGKKLPIKKKKFLDKNNSNYSHTDYVIALSSEYFLSRVEKKIWK
jgi:hypothetical protein